MLRDPFVIILIECTPRKKKWLDGGGCSSTEFIISFFQNSVANNNK